MDPKMLPWAKKAAAKGKGWPAKKIAEAGKKAEALKGAAKVDNPFALARWQTARGKA